MKTLRKNIMRRIYYAYALRVLVNRNTIHMSLMAGVLVVFFRFVSIGSVLQNLSEVTVGRIGGFMLTAVENTEVWTLLSLLVLFVIFLSYVRGIVVRAPRPMQTA